MQNQPQQQQQFSRQEMANFNQTITQQENRFYTLMRQITSSPYMPNREQVIQLASTLLTILLMLLLGPAVASQAGLIQALVRQVVPLLVAASVHYAADRAAPMEQLPSASQVSQANIAPVMVEKSALSQTI